MNAIIVVILGILSFGLDCRADTECSSSGLIFGIVSLFAIAPIFLLAGAFFPKKYSFVVKEVCAVVATLAWTSIEFFSECANSDLIWISGGLFAVFNVGVALKYLFIRFFSKNR